MRGLIARRLVVQDRLRRGGSKLLLRSLARLALQKLLHHLNDCLVQSGQCVYAYLHELALIKFILGQISSSVQKFYVLF